ncbi:MAG TPA: DUF1269 domain-containing protein [Solirubrobacteraceae bacterium]|nr:DUF1269 domain-containing protein [Solirubrobacteraceae bacterium]
MTVGGPDTLAVWRFDGPETAESVLPRLEQLAREHMLEIEDAALVRWPPRHRMPRVQELGAIDGPGHLWGGFWGVLLALIFLTPIAGPRFGAAAGAVAGTLADFGVADDFVKCVRDSVTPGTSAVFVLGSRDCPDRISAALGDTPAAVIRSDLSDEQTRHLRDALGDESVQRLG